MPRAFGFDGDSAYYESLQASVLASEAKKKEEKATAERERRRSIGLPEEEEKKRRFSFGGKKKDPERKKSVGEKVSNFVFNAGRSTKAQRWGEERVGLGDGETVRITDRDTDIHSKRKGQGQENGGLGTGHGVAEVIR